MRTLSVWQDFPGKIETMTHTTANHFLFTPANDDRQVADAVPAHIALRTRERRLMLSSVVLAISVLSATIVHGYVAMQPIPDMVTFAFRV